MLKYDISMAASVMTVVELLSEAVEINRFLQPTNILKAVKLSKKIWNPSIWGPDSATWQSKESDK